MRELFTMWKDTRMIMLVAVVAAIYAAVLLPFKLFTVIPGITSVRPANVFPVIFGLMFGPAAAWGAAIGNLIGDVFGGTLGLGSIFGFLGNFFFGYVGYKLWGNLGPLSSGEEPRMDGLSQIIEYVVIAITASAACAAIIAWGLDLLGLVPFTVLGPTIMINNSLAAVVLGPPLLYLTYPRVKEMGLLYADVMREEDLEPFGFSQPTVAALGVVVVALAWLALGVFVFSPQTTMQMALGAVGFVLLVVLALLASQGLPEQLQRAGAR
jgi:energy-coupling factor transport system substrate-specific component